ncbi:MAG: hypothetical protein H6657_06005 [Ardenticatenaceae bacterium]|nr:hypothetical protein [Ardenticatenaceae bacterium]
MKQNIVNVMLGFGPDEEIDLEGIRSDFVTGLKEYNAFVDMVPGPSLSDSIREKLIIDDANSETVKKYLLLKLSEEDFIKLNRPHRNLEGITFGDLERIGRPYPIGGGAAAFEYIVKILETDAPTAIAALGALSVVIRQLIQSTVDKGVARAISVKIGDFSFSSTGLSKEDAIKDFEIFYSKYLELNDSKDSTEQGNVSSPVAESHDEV